MKRDDILIRKIERDIRAADSEEEEHPETIREAIEKLDAHFPYLRGVEKRESALGPRPPQQPIFRKSRLPNGDMHNASSFND